MNWKKETPPEIRFHCDPDMYGVVPEPYPASKNIPDWLKKMEGVIPASSPDGYPGESIKHCMPVLDAYSAGYIIPSPASVRFVVDDTGATTTWRGGDKPFIESHSSQQVSSAAGWPEPYMKWLNPWRIELPEGYSALITEPFNQPANVVFRCLTGVVDCDRYTNAVNFPFYWSGPRPYDDIIPAGTPLVQVIPFRREPWTLKVEATRDDEVMPLRRMVNKVNLAMHAYRDNYRSIKRWR